jgi:hypothetical protein
MSRLGVTVSPRFMSSGPAPRPAANVRRVRDISALTTAEKSQADAAPLSPGLLKAMMWLSLLAAALMCVALWRLYHFPH